MKLKTSYPYDNLRNKLCIQVQPKAETPLFNDISRYLIYFSFNRPQTISSYIFDKILRDINEIN